MINRRELIKGLGCACAGSILTPATALAATEHEGCMIHGLESSARGRHLRRGAPKVSTTSGDRQFDRALANTLNMLVEQFHVEPAFSYYFDDSGENAMATKGIVDWEKEDGAVLYGRKLLEQQKREVDRYWHVHVVAVCAHEFGHIAQYNLHDGVAVRELKHGHRTVRRLELHADFLAGWFAGWRKSQMPSFPAAEIAQAKYNVGDHARHNRNHHGTPEERGRAVTAGFKAFEKGWSFDKTFLWGVGWAMKV